MYANELYYLLICFREDLQKEGIDAWFVELRNQNRVDDDTEEILTWKANKDEAIDFANKYISNNSNVQYYEMGEI